MLVFTQNYEYIYELMTVIFMFIFDSWKAHGHMHKYTVLERGNPFYICCTAVATAAAINLDYRFLLHFLCLSLLEIVDPVKTMKSVSHS
jgi:hypothetical protein